MLHPNRLAEAGLAIERYFMKQSRDATVNVCHTPRRTPSRDTITRDATTRRGDSQGNVKYMIAKPLKGIPILRNLTRGMSTADTCHDVRDNDETASRPTTKALRRLSQGMPPAMRCTTTRKLPSQRNGERSRQPTTARTVDG